MLNIAELEKFVEAAMQAAKVPGVALAIVHERKVMYARGFGVTSIEDGGMPVTPQTIFRIGSTSKPLTTTAIMRLVEAGTLELDTPINEIMPDLELSVPGAIGEITLRKLLSHTAALPTAAEHYGSREAAGLRAGVYGDIASYPLVAPVDKIWSYSNPGINFAGYVAELVSGKPYTELMQELVFDPLEMKRTTLDPTVAMTYPLAQSHTLDDEGNLVVDHHYADNTMHYPSGFIMSTALDLANFAIMHLSGGSYEGKQVLSPESISAMHTPQVKFAALNGDGYGLTLSSFDYKGVRQVGHGGRISSFASHFEMVPETGTAVVILANNSALWSPQEHSITKFILDALLDLPSEMPPVATIEPDRSKWDQLVGTYTGANSGAAEVLRDGNELSIIWQGQTLPLKAVSADLYIAQPPEGDPIPVSFTVEGSAPAEYIQVLLAPGFAVSLERLNAEPNFHTKPGYLAHYVGSYDGALGPMSIRLEDDQLFVKAKIFGNAEFPAKVVDKDRFLLPIGLLSFDADGDALLGSTLKFSHVRQD
jgi:CubicO group peptidase (beta-lactamase class C family)